MDKKPCVKPGGDDPVSATFNDHMQSIESGLITPPKLICSIELEQLT